ncbi:aldo/keto reductase family protein [Halomonas sp. HL-93]|uniref:aldo/keto reductase family protein n=1 Tax=Halomonas sp. HL-93 TaxID=1666906 RepID=UPI0007F0D4C3|nr:aldo/keto reductase [Halomonas sp. HL-93]SBR46121.1 aflatoxin B1 aldehyde reductase [Halomonas sp. HL-93]
MPVKAILGTMTFGPQVTLDESVEMTEHFTSRGNDELDTAYVYNSGDSEKFLGQACKQLTEQRLKIATKVNPRVTGKLDEKSIKEQLLTSLERLQQPSVETLYLHFPDPSTPLEVTLKACAELRQQGYFEKLGLSNYAAWEVAHIWHICDRNGWTLPSVYQGLYNGLSRNVESELIPALRELDMSFYAYNPLAGGILAGNYSNFDSEPSPGRFTHRPNYKQRYWKKEFFNALQVLQDACHDTGITMVEGALRWLSEHSALDSQKGDGLLIGASSLSQLQENLDILKRGALPPAVLDAFESAWHHARSEAPPYFRTTG